MSKVGPTCSGIDAKQSRPAECSIPNLSCLEDFAKAPRNEPKERRSAAPNAICGIQQNILRSSNKIRVIYFIAYACRAKRKKLATCAREHFGPAAWRARMTSRIVCLACQKRTRGRWTCPSCHETLPATAFSKPVGLHPSRQHDRQVCNNCSTRRGQERIKTQTAKRSTARMAR